MELENLKSIWNDLSKVQDASINIDAKEISKLIKGKTQNAFSKIKRSLFFEIGFLLLATGIFIVLILYRNRFSEKPLVIAILVLFAVTAVYYISKYYQLQRINVQGHNLKENLNTLIKTLEKYLNLYFIGSIVLTPISALTGFLYGYGLHENSDNWLREVELHVWIAGGVTACLLTLLMIPFMRWYLHKLYGNYLNELKHCFAELEEVPR